MDKQEPIMVHGNKGSVSLAAETKARKMIEMVYQRIEPWINQEERWLFHTGLHDKLREPYGLQVAWLDGVRRIFPDEYTEIKKDLGQSNIMGKELEYILGKIAGISG